MYPHSTQSDNRRLARERELPISRRPACDRSARTAPQRYKLAFLTWIGVYPIITLVLAVLGPAMIRWPLALRTLVLSALMVVALTWVVMPALQRMFGAWLTSAPRRPRRHPAGRAAVRIAGLALAMGSSALVAAVLPASAQAANLVLNGDFSQVCPGASCNWVTPLETTISQDTSTFVSAPASLRVSYNGQGSASGAATAFASCIAVTPGTTYTFSFAYRFSTLAHVEFVGGGVHFFSGACAGTPFSNSSVGGLGTTTGDNQWHQASGSITAPAGAQHVLVGVTVACDAFPCPVGAFGNFDDVVFATAATTAARFRSLSAVATRAGTSVRWRTASEVDVAGFNVYRSWHGKRVRVNARLIAAANAVRGHAYRYLDRRPRPGTRYWVEAVSLDGSRSLYGPARVALA